MTNKEAKLIKETLKILVEWTFYVPEQYAIQSKLNKYRKDVTKSIKILDTYIKD